MLSTYRLNADELDIHFLDALKTLFQNKTIEIVVTDVTEEVDLSALETDETEYLLSSEANKHRLLTAIENVENGQNLISVDMESLE